MTLYVTNIRVDTSKCITDRCTVQMFIIGILSVSAVAFSATTLILTEQSVVDEDGTNSNSAGGGDLIPELAEPTEVPDKW